MTYAIVGVIFLLLAGATGYFGWKLFQKQKSGKKEQDRFIPTTQDQLPFEYLRNGTLKTKKGSYIKIVEVPNINIELMEPEEQEGYRETFAGILNSFDFRWQVLRQSRIVDISEYLDNIKERASYSENPLEKKQLEYYRQFMAELVKKNAVLTKKSFVVVPYEEVEKKKVSDTEDTTKKYRRNNQPQKSSVPVGNEASDENEILKEEQRYERISKILGQRAKSVDRQFRRYGVTPTELDDEELLELLYTAYNKDRSVYQPLRGKNPADFTTLHVQYKKKGGNKK